MIEAQDGFTISGTKPICSGAGLIDCALVTIQKPKPQLVLLDLKTYSDRLSYSTELWQTMAFKDTQTATIEVRNIPVTPEDCIRVGNWYIDRPGFWQGSVNPAACWAGGAAGLLDYAMGNKRHDAHTLAHLGAMQSNIWTCEAILEKAGDAFDQYPDIPELAQKIGLNARHQIEQLCSDTLRRFARAYGPFPLACDSEISRRYQELDLFLRQCHAERDLESLGQLLKMPPLSYEIE
jgi:alkylation response protein AidB-like acyl-CoA dehydrogenase